MLSCSIWFSAPSLWMDGGLGCRCVGRVYGADCAVRTINTTYAAALKTTIHPQIRCRKPYAATQHLMLLMMGVCTGNMSSWEYINKITLFNHVGISHYLLYVSTTQFLDINKIPSSGSKMIPYVFYACSYMRAFPTPFLCNLVAAPFYNEGWDH